MFEPEHKIRLLLVDDDESFLRLFLNELEVYGRNATFEVFTASSGQRALELVQTVAPDAVVTDVEMPGLSGLDTCLLLLERFPNLPIILLTAFGSVDKAVLAMKMGAYHYFQKPVSDSELFWSTIAEAATKKRSTDELEVCRQDLERHGPDSQIVGESRSWREVMSAVEQVAPLNSTVLITGETGTGKEVVARAIHRLSPRANRPLVSVSCVEFAGTLLEAELFGHERGAFTGAFQRRRGIFERAHGGTLFLDEIAETSAEVQVKLLRVLDGSEFFRIGGQEPLRVDFRLLAATNRDLSNEVKAGRFRQDLYFRLSVFPIQLRPLRERPEDIPLLTRHIIRKVARRIGRPVKPVSGAAVAALVQAPWPGNIRELENLIERALIVSTSEELGPGDFFSGLYPLSREGSGCNLEDVERFVIRLALERCNGNKSKASELLGIARKTLSDKLARYEIRDYLNS